MKLNEAIAQVDSLRENAIDEATKRAWLTRVDQYVFDQIVSQREGAPMAAFIPYGEGDGERELLIPPPYDEAYLHYLEAEIYRATREIEKYASCAALYNGVVNDYKNKYFRERRQKAIPNMRYW
jgi:hypothetical protein